jgi:hypothetical protein
MPRLIPKRVGTMKGNASANTAVKAAPLICATYTIEPVPKAQHGLGSNSAGVQRQEVPVLTRSEEQVKGFVKNSNQNQTMRPIKS